MNKNAKLGIFTLVTTILFIPLSFFVSSMFLAKFIDFEFSFFLWLDYVKAYGFNEKDFILIGATAVGVLTFLSPSILIICALIAGREKRELYGSATLGKDRDLAKSNLLPKKSEIGKSKHPEILLGKIPKGRFKGDFLRFAGQQFVYVAAPTRSGKGVGLVIPNCLNYRDSIVVLDIKGENFEFTGGFRQSVGQDVFCFAPGGYASNPEEIANNIMKTHRWNPLSYIRRELEYREGDVLNIASILFPDKGGDNAIWNQLAGELFSGMVLFMLDTEDEGEPITLGRLYELLTPSEGLANWMKSKIKFYETIEKPLSKSTISKFNSFIGKPENTQGSVLTNIMPMLIVFNDPICSWATSGDDFDLRDVRKKRMSIYIVIAPTDLDKFSKLINLFFSQLINVNTRIQPQQDPSLKYQCLLILDEFTSMGYVGVILKAIAYTASYNIRYLFIIQNDGQIDNPDLYGKEGGQTIRDNCAVHVIYPPKQVDEVAERVSKTIGTETVKVKNKSKQAGSAASYSYSEQSRDVLMPQEVVDLGVETYKGVAINAIYLMEKVKPFIAHKIIYFDEPEFNQRKEFSLANRVPVPEVKFNKTITQARANNAVPKLKEDEYV